MSDETKSIDINEGQGGVGFVIRQVWAFLAVHADGDEGVIAERVGEHWIPFMAADKTRLEQLSRRARDLGKEHGKVVRLVRFDVRTEVETFYPDGRRERPEAGG